MIELNYTHFFCVFKHFTHVPPDWFTRIELQILGNGHRQLCISLRIRIVDLEHNSVNYTERERETAATLRWSQPRI